MTFSCRVSLESSWLCQFVRLPLFSMAFLVWRKTAQVFCRMTLIWGLCFSDVYVLMFFSWLDSSRPELRVFERKTLKGRFHHIISRVYIMNMIYHWWC